MLVFHFRKGKELLRPLVVCFPDNEVLPKGVFSKGNKKVLRKQIPSLTSWPHGEGRQNLKKTELLPPESLPIFLNPAALRMVRTLRSFDHSECSRVIDTLCKISWYFSAGNYKEAERWCGMSMRMLKFLATLKASYEDHVSLPYLACIFRLFFP